MNKRIIEYSLFGIGLFLGLEANALHGIGELVGNKIVILPLALLALGTAFVMRAKRNPH